MHLPDEIRNQFRRYGSLGGRERAVRMTPERRRAIAQRAGALRWIRQRFGESSFAELGLPGGEIMDAGLADLAAGDATPESLLVSIAAPRLCREGIPVGAGYEDPEERLFETLSAESPRLAHARYRALLRQAVSFADACGVVRRRRAGDAA